MEKSKSTKVHKTDVERFEKGVLKLKKIVDDINEYCPKIKMVCFPTSGEISIVYDNGEDDLYNCETITSIIANCDACS